MPIDFPPKVLGYMSPQPTVVTVTTKYQKKLSVIEGSNTFIPRYVITYASRVKIQINFKPSLSKLSIKKVKNLFILNTKKVDIF